MKAIHHTCSTCHQPIVVVSPLVPLQRDAEGYSLLCPACGAVDRFDDWPIYKLEQLFPRDFEPGG